MAIDGTLPNYLPATLPLDPTDVVELLDATLTETRKAMVGDLISGAWDLVLDADGSSLTGLDQLGDTTTVVSGVFSMTGDANPGDPATFGGMLFPTYLSIPPSIGPTIVEAEFKIVDDGANNYQVGVGISSSFAANPVDFADVASMSSVTYRNGGGFECTTLTGINGAIPPTIDSYPLGVSPFAGVVLASGGWFKLRFLSWSGYATWVNGTNIDAKVDGNTGMNDCPAVLAHARGAGTYTFQYRNFKCWQLRPNLPT